MRAENGRAMYMTEYTGSFKTSRKVSCRLLGMMFGMIALLFLYGTR
jgi:hypothetical protein